MAHDVIISYSSHDKTVADACCSALEAQRIRCWIAPRDVLAGTEYGEAILHGIEGSKVMLLVFSAKSNDSTYCKKEVERAVSLGKIIVPFRIDETLPSGAMSFFLGNTHWLDALTPPLKLRIDELVGSIARLLGRQGDPDRASVVAKVVPKAETDAHQFERMFAERPDVIAEVESEACHAPEQLAAEFEKLLVRLEVRTCEPPPPNWSLPGNKAYRERLQGLIERHDGDLEEARAYVVISRQCDVRYREWCKTATDEQRNSMYSISEQEDQSGYREWRQALDTYLQAVGGGAVIRSAIVALGQAVFPLVCISFRRFDPDGTCYLNDEGFYGWGLDIELAKVMSQLKDLRALPFIAGAVLKHEDKMTGHNDWGLEIVRAVQAFGVDRRTLDECFERLVGISASEILRAKRDSERH